MKNAKLSRRRIDALKKNFSGWTLLIPTMFLFVFLVWRPIVTGIMYSFYDLKGFTPNEFVGVDNFKTVLSDTNFIDTLWNTVKYVLYSLVIGLPLPFIAAVLLNEATIGKGFFKFTLYLPVVVPGIAANLLWKYAYMDGTSGLLNMALGWFGAEPVSWLASKSLVIPLLIVSMSWHGFGGTMLMYLSALQSLDSSLYEAARIDGAGFWKRLRYILFPHMRGIILLMAVRQIIGVFSITEQPLVMTGGGPNNASMSLGLMNFNYAFRYGQMDNSLALGVITFLLLIGLTFVYFSLEKVCD